MAVSFRSVGARANNGGTGAVAVPVPAGAAAGDLLVIQAVCLSAVTPATPAGWTKLFGPTTLSGTTNKAHLYWKIADGTEGATVSLAKTSGSGQMAAFMYAYQGAHATTPIDTHATASMPTSGTSAVTPTVTTTQPNTLLLRTLWNLSASSVTVTPPGTDTERYDSYDGSTFFMGFYLADQPAPAAGATGTTTATLSTATSGGLAATVAVAPAAAPASTFVPRIIHS